MLNKEKVDKLIDGFDEFNPEDLTNVLQLIHFIYTNLSSRDELICAGEKIIKKLGELDGISIEDSTVTNKDGEEELVHDMLEYINKEIKEHNERK